MSNVNGTRYRKSYKIMFYDVRGKFISGGVYGFEEPVEKNLKAWCYEWMKLNAHRKPMIYQFDYVGMREAK